MSASGKTERITGMSLRSKARLAGVCEMLEGLTSASGQLMILGRLVASGYAAATGVNNQRWNEQAGVIAH